MSIAPMPAARRQTVSRARLASIAWLSGAISVALLAAGCGGGGSSSGQSASTTSAATTGSTGSTGATSSAASTGTSSNSGVSLSLSPTTLNVSATTGQSAPTATFQVLLAGQTQDIYVSGGYSANGIASISEAVGTSSVTMTVQFQPPATLGAGVYEDTVQVMACYDEACTQQVSNSPQTVQVQYTVTNSLVQVSSIAPATIGAGGPAFTLTVTGSNFTPQSQVLWNGSSVVTTYVSATQLTAQITAADIATSGSVPVSVLEPVYGASNPVNFTISPAQLTLTSISPSAVATGGPSFMLTVLGAGFTATSTVQWNGATRPTTVVASYELVAQISAADIATSGTSTITVHDPGSSIGTTAGLTLTIAAPSIDAVAYQINAAHTGSVNFASITLPTSTAWSVDVGGTPSYALITQGLVIVTVTVGSGSQLVALDQTSGAVVWGPVAMAGKASAAYDAGTVFVLSSQIGNAATMEAFNVQTGQQLWSTVLQGQYDFTAAPTAADGMVYTGGAGDAGTLYALDETTGNIVWTQEVQNGNNSTPAVSADGVYVTYPCWTYDFRPATGDSIWNNNTGCEGGGGATPVVSNQLVYSPNGTSGYNGTIYNAESGLSGGTYSADAPPAFNGGTGYFLQSGTLRGITTSNNTVLWSFAGDGQLTGAAIAVNQYVFIGSSSGNLYALDGTSGQQVWSVTLPAAVAADTTGLPFSGLAAGDGLLVVPAGTKVTAYVLSTNP